MAMSFGRVAISRRVVVNLKSGPAIEGVLWDDRKPIIILRDAVLHTNGQHSPMDGDVLIDHAEVAFIQVPDGREF